MKFVTSQNVDKRYTTRTSYRSRQTRPHVTLPLRVSAGGALGCSTRGRCRANTGQHGPTRATHMGSDSCRIRSTGVCCRLGLPPMVGTGWRAQVIVSPHTVPIDTDRRRPHNHLTANTGGVNSAPPPHPAPVDRQSYRPCWVGKGGGGVYPVVAPAPPTTI